MNRFRMVFIVVMVLALAAYLFYLAIQSTEKQNSQNIDLNTLIIPVVGVKVKSQNLSETINLVGTLQARDAVEIKSAVDGTIAKVDFTSGQKVKKGDPLITFSRDKFRASLMGAEANLSLARTTFSRYKLLLKDGGVSGLDLDQAANQVKVSEAAVDAARDDFDHTLVRAPFDGVMGEKLVSAGQFIAQGESLGFLVDQSSMKADFRIPERYLNRFKDGQAVTVKVDAYPQDRFNGKIVFIAPVVDESTRTILVTAEVDNPDGKLRQGMFAQVDVAFDERPNALVVPEGAVVFKGRETLVYTVDANGTVVIKPVACGLHLNGLVEIVKGLEAGETVITEGFQKVHAGSKVTVR